MKRVLSLSMLFWLMANTIHAAIVTEQEAKQKALDFMTARGHRTTAAAATRIGKTSRRVGAPATGTDRYYLFNIGHDEGFVIVSGDDRTAAILGYADSGSISFDNMPDALRYLLNGYAEEMEWLEGQEESAAAAQARAAAPAHAAIRSTIAPLIQTRWDQDAPYNNYCPYINSEKTVTGCVATSMAQVMYYHKWPTETTAIPAYSITTKDQNYNNYTISSEILRELPDTTFNWNDMTTTYSSSSTGAPADAVAKLMQYCGWSLQMIYGLPIYGGSGTYTPCVAEALKTYFGYDNNIRSVYRKFYSYQEWISLIYDELIGGRPVILGAQSSGGGHSFICDGYDTDDYFHINWGWSGSSDGYFRLSLLNPYDQGIGGSTTRDGFSAGQTAVIGIQKPTDSTNSYCLSLEGLNFDSPDANATTKTFTRDAETNSFTGINLSVTICSYRFRENSFGYAIQLVNSNGSVVETLATENLAMPFNKNSYPKATIAIPSGVDDGTYTIKVMSRLVGTADWQECYMADRFQLSAEISGNSLTINVPIPATTTPTAATFRVNGNMTKGYEQEVIASITGGANDYHDDLYLRVNGTTVMGRQADIPAGQTVDVHFKYTPTKSGENTLAIYNTKTGGTLIGKSTVINITDSDASNTQELTFGDPVFVNLTTDATRKLYGNAVRAKIKVYNPSTENSYASQLNCSLRKYDSMNENGHEGEYVDATVIRKFITIAKSESTENLSFTDVDFEFNGVEPGKFYRLRFSYTKADENGNATTASGPISACYEMGAGYMACNSDGTVTIKPVGGTITADEESHVAVFVDLSAISSFDGITVTPSSNPNCLYWLPEQPATTRGTATVPSGLEGCNVIYGETAENITLNDNYDFYSPIAFTANKITYTRTFTVAANGSSGWNTIMLPFDVTHITVSNGTSEPEKTVDWFHSDTDTDKNFWLKTFSGDNTNTVYFDYAPEMAANTPYIIAVPDDRWGEKWQMTGKPVTFYGENSYIAATIEHSISGNNYKFCGKTAATSLNDGYALNDEGSTFTKITGETPIGAFHAWITAVSISSFARPALAIGSGLPVSICMPTTVPTATDADIYDLQGRRLTTKPRGIYINSGKKYISK